MIEAIQIIIAFFVMVALIPLAIAVVWVAFGMVKGVALEVYAAINGQRPAKLTDKITNKFFL